MINKGKFVSIRFIPSKETIFLKVKELKKLNKPFELESPKDREWVGSEYGAGFKLRKRYGYAVIKDSISLFLWLEGRPNNRNRIKKDFTDVLGEPYHNALRGERKEVVVWMNPNLEELSKTDD